MLSLLVVVVASLPLLVISWPSLRHRHVAGVYRFFGYETTLLLTVLNIAYWAHDAQPVFRLATLALAVIGAGLLAHGISLLHRLGDGAFGIDDTRNLVMKGAYRYIRHPIYGGVLFFGWSTFLQDASWLSVALVATMTVFLYAAAKLEERDMLAKFGDDYAQYIQHTRMFILFVF